MDDFENAKDYIDAVTAELLSRLTDEDLEQGVDVYTKGIAKAISSLENEPNKETAELALFIIEAYVEARRQVYVERIKRAATALTTDLNDELQELLRNRPKDES